MRYLPIPRIMLLLLLLTLYSGPGKAQEQNVPFLAKNAYAEKIYMQLDADAYLTNQTIWFKAIILASASHLPSMLSGVLHVELVAPDEQIIATRRIKLNQGGGHGAFQLKTSHPSGKYLLRAYTEWNRNFGNDFVYSRYIDVFPTTQETKMSAIIDVKLEENAPKAYRLQAKLFPRIIDALHKKQLPVYLTVDGKKDSLTLKESAQGYYLLDYPLSPKAATATIQMRTDNGLSYAKSIATPLAPLDLQFFPEGGKWLQDVPTKFGFKAVSTLGKGIPVCGTILTSQGDTVTSFQSNHLGIGSVYIQASAGVSYHAVLDSLADHAMVISAQYPLPLPVDRGHTLAIKQADQDIKLFIHANKSTEDSLFIRVSCRGDLYYILKTTSQNKQIMASLPKNTLPEGIILFTLLDQEMRPIAERLFFNERLDTRLSIQASTDRSGYAKRSKTDIHIQVSGKEGLPTEAQLSLMAVGSDHIGKKPLSRQNILTHFLLQSELRGEVEEPNYYFQGDTAARSRAIDALLLTQGWRNYRYDEPPPATFLFQPEVMPTVSGDVAGVISLKKQAGIQLSLLGFGDNSFLQIQNSDSLGRFYFGIPDQYTDTLQVLLQTANKKGKNRDYSINLKEQPALGMSYDPLRTLARIDTVASRLAGNRQALYQQDEAYRIATQGIQLDEIVVERKVRSEQEQLVFDKYGEADAVISGKAIQDKEKKWSYGLYSVLLFNFSKEIRIDRAGGAAGHLVANVTGSEPTLVVVDGIAVPGYSYDIIPNLPPSEVKSFEIIRFAKNFANLYMQTYPDASPMNIPTSGHVIAIYTHAGKGLYAVQSTPGILQAAIPVYSPTVEFYAPRYEAHAEIDVAKPDLRTLLHWLPHIRTAKDGTASLDYYNSDNLGETTVIIEAYNAAGEIGYLEWTYTVNAEEQ